MTETIDPIKVAQSQDEFDVLSFVSGTAYPTASVQLYTDVAAVKELLKYNQERLDAEVKNATAEGDVSIDIKPLDERVEKLTQRVQETAITFNLRGMPPGIVEEIYPASDEDVSDEEEQNRTNKLIAHTIQSVVSATGAMDSRVWDVDAVTTLRKNIQGGEFVKLVKAVTSVNFNALVFDKATDAGFLGGSTDVAS